MIKLQAYINSLLIDRYLKRFYNYPYVGWPSDRVLDPDLRTRRGLNRILSLKDIDRVKSIQIRV